MRLELDARSQLVYLGLIENLFTVEVVAKADEVVPVKKIDVALGVNLRHEKQVFQDITDSFAEVCLEVIYDQMRGCLANRVNLILQIVTKDNI